MVCCHCNKNNQIYLLFGHNKFRKEHWTNSCSVILKRKRWGEGYIFFQHDGAVTQLLVSISNSEDVKAIHAVETWLQSLSKEISHSTFCWKADGLSILGHGGHSVNQVASPRASNQQWGVLQHPYVSSSQNPATALRKMGTPVSVAPWQCETTQQ
jgi:hypothetical protein